MKVVSIKDEADWSSNIDYGYPLNWPMAVFLLLLLFLVRLQLPHPKPTLKENRSAYDTLKFRIRNKVLGLKKKKRRYSF